MGTFVVKYKIAFSVVFLGLMFGACALTLADESQSGPGWYCEKDVACGQYQSPNPDCFNGTGRCKGLSMSSRTSACKPSLQLTRKCDYVNIQDNYISCVGICVDDPNGRACTLKVYECMNPTDPETNPEE